MLPFKIFPTASGNMHHSLPLRLHSVGYHSQPPVHHPNGIHFCQLIIGKKGRGLFRVSGEKEFVLNSEQAVIIKPVIRHEYRALDDMWETATLWFDCNPFVLSQFRMQTHKPMELLSSKRAMELIELLWWQGGEEEGVASKTSELIYSLLLEIKLQSAGFQEKDSNPVLTTQKVMDYIHMHYARKLTLDELSNFSGYTPQHLNRIFKKESGCSVYQYILRIQLEQAANMLRNQEMTVERVVYEVGMEWRSFYRLFQRMYQVSPGEFRNQVKRRTFGS